MEKLLTVPEVAEKLAVPRSRIYYMLMRKEIPCVKIGASVRFKPQEIEDWVNGKVYEVQRN